MCYLKIDVSCESSVNFQHISPNATPATEFAPCRHLTRPWQCGSQKHATRHVSSAAPATQNDDGLVRSAARATKTTTHLAKTSQKYCPCHTKRFSTRYETRLNVTPATRNEATRHWKPPKMTTSAELTIGTAIRPSRERLRTVADGCGRLRTVRQRRANTPSTSRPPEWNGNPCYAFGKKQSQEQ